MSCKFIMYERSRLLLLYSYSPFSHGFHFSCRNIVTPRVQYTITSVTQKQIRTDCLVSFLHICLCPKVLFAVGLTGFSGSWGKEWHEEIKFLHTYTGKWSKASRAQCMMTPNPEAQVFDKFTQHSYEVLILHPEDYKKLTHIAQTTKSNMDI